MLAPKKFADIRGAIAGKRIEDAREFPDRIVTSELERVDDDGHSSLRQVVDATLMPSPPAKRTPGAG